MTYFPSAQPDWFACGQRIEIHPGTDLAARGARYGTVIKVGRKFLTIKLDRLSRPVRIAPSLVQIVV